MRIRRSLVSPDTSQIQQNSWINRIANWYSLPATIAYGIEDDQGKHLLQK